jgi:L-amino acid N-acyltransferase YncA
MSTTEVAQAPAPRRAQNVIVRNSREGDVNAMLAIYLHHIRQGVAPSQHVDIEPPDAEDLKRRRKNMHKHKLPHLVAEADGVVVGYAYAVPFRKRPAYRYAVKHSIYVHKDHLHSGIGRLLLPVLIDACSVAGYRQMIAYIDAKNLPSIQLHKAHDFRQVGVLEAVAYRFGRWADSILMQRALGPGGTAPPEAK